MAHEKVSNTEAIDAFWGQLKDRTTVMLGAVGGDRTQPMTAFAERENELVWFFTRNDTDLAQEAISPARSRSITISAASKNIGMRWSPLGIRAEKKIRTSPY